MKRKVPIEQLPQAIEEVLKAGPRIVDAIARQLGYSVTPIKRRLEQLELDGRVHKVGIPGRRGRAYRWHYGPSATTRVFPAIDQRAPRDPFVAALFGPVEKKQS